MDNISGFLNINKPAGCTSHDVVALLRKLLNIKKIGHCGTLDPFATGVLVIGLNNATRLFEYLPSDKDYIAKVIFGIETDTDDITGKIVRSVDYIPKEFEIRNKLKDFLGEIKQKPPIYSAVKINGERAYKLARKDSLLIEQMKEKTINIRSIEFLSFIKNELEIKIQCSSGTYIRSFARDLGKALNTYATLEELKRIKVGDYFTLEKSISPYELDKSTLLKHLINPSEVINLKKIHLGSEQITDISMGKSVQVSTAEKVLNDNNDSSMRLQLLDNNNKLIAIGTITDNYLIKPIKVLLHK